MMFSEKLRVIKHAQCAPSWYQIGFEAPHFAAESVAGQFFMVKVGCEGTDPFLRRPMSLYRLVRDAEGDPTGFELLYKVVGRGTALLSKVCAGDTLGVLGPLGRGFKIEADVTEHFIVAGGTGVAPMVALADALVLSGIRPKVFYGARTCTELPCIQDFDTRNVDLAVFTEDGSLGAKGFVTLGLGETLSAAVETEISEHGAAVYACGPHEMLAAVARLAERANVPCQLSLESRMGCGLGACMACAVRGATSDTEKEPHYIRVCMQGPVIDSRRISWEDDS
jgi:dihydroorotate dehydrogenase electron transfer subunit